MMNAVSRTSVLTWVATLSLLTGLHPGAKGGDFWLEVEGAAPGKPGERMLHLREGEGFKPEAELPLQKERTSRFDLYADQTRRRDLLAAGQEGQIPVAKLPPEPSACLVVMERKAPAETMDADKFNRMLADDGQEAVAAQRAKLGQGNAEARVSGFWFLKTLVPGQDSPSTLPNTFYKRRVEQRLEILLQNNPGRLAVNHRLTVKVLFDGKPLTGAKVFACRHEAGAAGGGAAPPATAGPGGASTAGDLTAVTSAQGLAEFKLDQSGGWLVQTAFVRAEGERRPNANVGWDRLAASYSFVAKDAPAGGGPGPVKTGGGGDGK